MVEEEPDPGRERGHDRYQLVQSHVRKRDECPRSVGLIRNQPEGSVVGSAQRILNEMGIESNNSVNEVYITICQYD